VEGKNKSRFHIHTNQPQDFFQVLSGHGTLLEQKVDDMVMQQERIHNPLNDRVIVTDSIADLPQDFIDKHQIHVVNLSILIGDEAYLDKLTISNKRVLEFAKSKRTWPTSSQPSTKQVDNMYNYLLSYYKEVIVIPVAKVLSGSYNVFSSLAEKYNKDQVRVHVIDSKQNSVAQGLLVKEAALALGKGVNTQDVIEGIKDQVKKSKILVSISTLDNMIHSGRLSVRAGSIAKKVGLKPIVTLDENGKGGIFKVAFSEKTSMKKILKHLKSVHDKQGLASYAITYVDDRKKGLEFARQVTAVLGFEPAYVTESSGIIAIGAGRGATAVAYISK
jgi:DegV family protein with EDD domain